MVDDYGIPDDALEQRIAELSDEQFRALVNRTRAPAVPQPTTTHAQRVRAAEQTGDWKTAFDLKARQLGRLMNPGQEG